MVGPVKAGRESKASDQFVAAGLALATMCLGAVRAGDRPFWLDESATAVAVDQPLGGLVRLLGHTAGMGPYFLSLWGWARLGDSEWWLRMFSVVGGACTVAALYMFACRAAGRRTAALAAIGLICNPFFLRYLTELRTYSWVMCLAVVSTALFLRFRSTPTTANALRYGASVGAMLSLLFFSVGAVVAHLIFCGGLIRDRRGRSRLALAGVVGAVILAPFLIAVRTSHQINWIPSTTIVRILDQTSLALGGRPLAVLLVVGCVCLFVVTVRHSTPWARSVPLEVGLAICVLVPVSLLMISIVQPAYLARYLAALLPFSVLSASAGFVAVASAISATVSKQRLITAAVAAGFVLGFPGSPVVDLARPDDMSAPAAFLESAVRPGDAVIFGPSGMEFEFRYYWPTRTAMVIDVRGSGGAALSPQGLRAALAGHCRVWHIRRDSEGVAVATLEQLLEQPHSTSHTFNRYTITELDAC